MLINAMFVTLNMYHLVYLGMVFDGTADEEGYSYAHTIEHWRRWSFSSPLVVCALYALSNFV